MTIELEDRPDAALEARLRRACLAVIPHLLDSPQTTGNEGWPEHDHDNEHEHVITGLGNEADLARGVHRSPRVVVAAAAALLLVAVSAVWATQQRDTGPVGDAPATSPSPVTTALPPASSSLPVESLAGSVTANSALQCDDDGCSGFGRLPVVPGATDYYAGPMDLGSPQTALPWFDTITRCAVLTSDFSACQEIEGLAGVSLVSYPTELTADTTARSESSLSINIGTTFTEISPADYAAGWGVTSAGPGAQVAATVRGHSAVRYDDGGVPAVVWQEQPGVLVWVEVPPEDQDRLFTIAEGVRRIAGPTTIADRVMVAPLANPWQAQSNDGNGLITATSGGADCVGLDHIDTCGPDIHARTIVRPRSDGTTVVAGSTPPDASSVRIELATGEQLSIDTIAFANYRQRFFLTTVAAGQVRTVTWLNAAGDELASERHVTTPPDAGTQPTAA